ncbi:Inositol-1-monophosphatase [Photobacterium marinum]|uniref:Inositol-1-monophosphatase n=1 Tax=Photobacterium marinum TaxID=1056511 RepID=L8JGT1_9GAMM|nr:MULTISPECIES: inositol monophosphatase family protein [Photobacterium]ELR66627.1 Inositol-1-monophosphatase [Photobacterium marinum]
MILMVDDLELLLEQATEAALKAGKFIAGFDRTQLQVNHKAGGTSLSAQVVTQVDLDSQKLIFEVLEPGIEKYDLALLGEENASENDVSGHARFRKSHFWCIDPLDGTLPFIEGSDGFAVSIALVAQSGWPVLGVIYNPATGDLYQALNPLNAPEKRLVLKNGELWLGKENNCIFTLFVDRSFQSDPRYPVCIEQLEALVHQQGLDGMQVVNTCGAVMNAIGVMENAPACYFKLPKPCKGGGSLWDFSATAAIAQACGAVSATDVFGASLDLNRRDSNFMNHKGAIYSSGVNHQAVLQLAQECDQ